MKGLKFPKAVRTIHIASGFDRASHLAVKFKVLMMDECRWQGRSIPSDLDETVNAMRRMPWDEAVAKIAETGVDVIVDSA